VHMTDGLAAARYRRLAIVAKQLSDSADDHRVKSQLAYQAANVLTLAAEAEIIRRAGRPMRGQGKRTNNSV
jgi:hypothetical protein